jgi:hypothetical protein
MVQHFPRMSEVLCLILRLTLKDALEPYSSLTTQQHENDFVLFVKFNFNIL